MGETGLRGRTGQQQILYGRVFRLENSYFLPDDRRAAMDVGSRNVAVLVCDVIGSTAALFCLNSRCILQVGSCTMGFPTPVPGFPPIHANNNYVT